MSPIVVTNSSPAGRISRVAAGAGGGGGGGTLIANFQASVDFGTPSTTTGTSFSPVTKGDATLFRDGTGQIWPCLHPVLQGPSYAGGAYVFRINNNAGPGANEIDFQFATAYTELFLEWHVYMPSGTESPSYGGRQFSGTLGDGTGNDKVLRLYDGTGDFGQSYGGMNTVGYGMSMAGTGDNTVEQLYMERKRTINVVPNAVKGVDYTDIGEVTPIVRESYAAATTYMGRWVRHRVRAKVASVANNDGIMQVWLDDTLVLNRTDLATYAVSQGVGVQNSFRYGYLYGYRNSGVQDSRIYIDNISFSTGGFV